MDAAAVAAATAVDDAVSVGVVGVTSYEIFTIMVSSSLLLSFVPLRFIVVVDHGFLDSYLSWF